MTTAIKRRRGTTTQHSTFTGLDGELTIDTTKETVVVHDAATAGGFPLLREDLSNNANVATLSGTQTISGTKTLSNNPILSGGTANGVGYLDGTKALTTGSALTFDGTKYLTISSSVGPRLYFDKTGTAANTSFVGSNSGMLSYNSDQFDEASSSGHQFVVDGTEGMRLTSTGLSLAETSDLTVNKGTANGIVYLNSSKVLSNDGFVTYDGSTFFVGRTFEAAATASFTGPYAQVGLSTGTDTANPDFRLVRRNNWPLTQIIRFRGESVSDAAVGMGLTIESLNNSAVYEMRYVISPDGAYQAWGKGTSERMRLNATGLGIGNSSPTAKLDVTGTAAISGAVTLSGGTANGVTYLNGSKVLTTGSALTFDGTNFGVNVASPGQLIDGSAANPRLRFTATSTGYAASQFVNTSGSTYFGRDNSAGSFFGIANGTVVYSSTNDPIGFFLGTNEQMRLTSTGLGIGTSSPASKLDVNGTARFGSSVYLNGTVLGLSAVMEGYNTSYGNLAAFRSVPGDGINPYLLITSSASGITFEENGSSYGSLMWKTSAIERMRLDASGNLGIGTSSPGAKLTVAAAEAIRMVNAAPYLSFYNAAQSTRFGYIQHNGTNLALVNEQAGSLEIYTNNTLKATLDSSGNLGLGVTPSAWGSGIKALQMGAYGVLAQATNVFNIGNNYYNNGTSSLYINAAYATLYQQATGEHKFFTAPSGTAGAAITFTQAMTLDASGNLLVGTTSNTGPGRICMQFPGSTTNGISMLDSTDTTGAAYLAFRNTVGNAVGTITRNGASSVAYNTSSDYRLKNITGPITTSGAYIDSLNPVEGTWKADGSTFVGLIAHEAQEASRTQVATGTKDGEEMQGMSYSSSEMIANMIAELKALRARVAALEAA